MMLRMGSLLVAALIVATGLGCAGGGACHSCSFSGRYCDNTCQLSGRYYEGGSCDAPCGSCGGYGGCDACRGGGYSTGGWLENFRTHCQGCGDIYYGEAIGPRCDSCDCDGNFAGHHCRAPFEFIADVWTNFWGCGGCGGCHSCGMEYGYDGGYGGGCATCGHGGMHGATIHGDMIAPPPPPNAPTSSHSTGVSRQSVLRPSGSTTSQWNAPAPRYTTRQMSYQESQAATANRNNSQRIATARQMPAPPSKYAAPRAAAVSLPTPKPIAARSTGSRVPSTAADFDLPPGARIIRIEEAE